MKPRHLLSVLCLYATALHADPLMVQIVNDSGLPDDEVFVLLSGSNIQSLAPAAMAAVDLAASPAPTGVTCGVPLTRLTPVGPLVSNLTGRSNSVYSFTVDSIASARLFMSYGPASAPACAKGNGIVQFDGVNAPVLTEPYRYDKMEFTYVPGSNGAADLTSLDFLGIPMKIESVNGATSSAPVVATRSFYLSADTLFSTVDRIFGAGASTYANPTTPANPTRLTRLYSPNTLAASVSPSGSPAPYPSLGNYLNSLTHVANLQTSGTQSFGAASPTYVNDNNQKVTVTLPQYTAAYDYSATVAGDGKGGYTLTLTGTVSGVPAPLPASTTITMNVSASRLDTTLYACPLDSSTFGVANAGLAYPADATTPAAQASYFNAVMGNSIYSWVVANIASAINFGYFDGGKPSETANNTANWFASPLPPAQPFGAWRNSNDGLYNPFAALIYNSSDSYGFPFSDRALTGVNPLLTFYDTSRQTAPYTLRVTALPDNQLDAPQARIGSATDTTLSVSWSKPANAPTDVTYEVTTYPPMAVTVSGLTATGATLTGLTPGMPYRISVTAHSASTRMNSLAIPIQGATTGTFAMAGSYGFQFGGINWAVPAGYKVAIAGQTWGGVGTNVMATGAEGVNYYPLVISDPNGQVVYQNAYQIQFAGNSGGGYQLVSLPLLGTADLPGGDQPLSPAPVPTGYPFAYPASNLVIGTPGAPVIPKDIVPVASIDCLFNWAEANFPSYLPPTQPTQFVFYPDNYPFLERIYPSNGNAIGLMQTDNNIYAYLAGGLYPEGSSNSWFDMAKCGSSPFMP